MSKNKSNILRKVTPIKNILVEIIDKNQKIKRYARYLTSKTPLFLKGLTYNNERREQPDLTETLTCALKDEKDTFATCRGEILIPYMFDKELLKEEKLLIFVHSPRSYIDRRSSSVEHEFFITVAVNIQYDEIEPYGSERTMEILCELLDEIDNNFVDEEYREDVGLIRFDIKRDRITERISDKGFVASTIPVNVTVSSMR